MTDQATLTVRFDSPDINSNDTLRLEQKPWDDVGKTTAIDIIRGMASMFFDEPKEEQDCGYDLTDRSMSTEIYAYPSRPDLVFRIGVTMGLLGGGVLESVPVNETIDFRLQSSATANYVANGDIVAAWSGKTYNAEGDIISPPVINIDNDGGISIDQNVYGSMRVSYKTMRYRYSLWVSPRVDSPENSYQTVVWAAWDGGVALLQVEPPPGAEEDLLGDTDCTDRGGNLVIGPDDDDDPLPIVEPGKEEEIYLDYCTWGEGGYAE